MEIIEIESCKSQKRSEHETIAKFSLIFQLILAGMKYNYASPACSSPSTTWERDNNEPKSMPDPEINFLPSISK